MKGIKSITIFIMSLLLFSTTVQGEYIRSIRVGDSWVYTIETNEQKKLLGLESINYTATEKDYIGDETLLQVNNISQSSYILELYERIIYNGYYHLTADNISMIIRFKEVKDFSVIKNYFTARGSIPFYFVAEGKININVNGTDHVTDFTTSHFYNNTEVLKSITDGYVYKTLEYYMFNVTYDTLYINVIVAMADVFVPSDKFQYQGYECRNITIETMELVCSGINYVFIVNDTIYHGNISRDFGLVKNEDWIFSYDVGLPLEINRKLTTSKNLMKNIESIENIKDLNYKFVLQDYSIQEATIQTTDNTIAPTDIIPFTIIPILFTFPFISFAKKRFKK